MLPKNPLLPFFNPVLLLPPQVHFTHLISSSSSSASSISLMNKSLSLLAEKVNDLPVQSSSLKTSNVHPLRTASDSASSSKSSETSMAEFPLSETMNFSLLHFGSSKRTAHCPVVGALS